MPFPRKLLNEGEELLLDLRPHWLFLASPTIALVVAIAFGIFASRWNPSSGNLDLLVTVVAIGALVLALAWFGAKYLIWNTTNFVLTGDRIISRRGVVAKQATEIPLERVNTVFFHQSVFERMVGAGDLTVESAGERGTESFTDIRKPAVVQREIYVAMEDNENRKFARMGGGAPTLSIAEQLEKLHQLVQQGALSPAEYEAQKAKLLGA
ncbi:MAG: PH domain-containing protein [Actinobacteria bacterium]|nr:PH domain-containing protein [Actinomycetota bacterium]